MEKKMETIIAAAQVGNHWAAFKADADLSEFDEAKIETWTFTGKPCNTGSMIRVNDKVQDFDLTRDERGLVEPAAYAQAYDAAFALEHVIAVDGPGVTIKEPTRDDIEALPPLVLREFVHRNDASRRITVDEFESLKKPKADAEKNEGPGNAPAKTTRSSKG